MTEQELERALRQALPPLEPDPLLIEQIMGRIESTDERRRDASPTANPPATLDVDRRAGRLRRWLPAALAAAVLIGFGSGHWAQQQRQRQVQARAQLLQGLTIASASLQDARSAILHSEDFAP